MLSISLMQLMACAPSHYTDHNTSSFKDHTGHTTEDGRDFTAGNEPRLETEKVRILEEEAPPQKPKSGSKEEILQPKNDPKPVHQEKGAPEKVSPRGQENVDQYKQPEFSFRKSFLKFKFLRYEADSKKPVRLGTQSFSLQGFFKEGSSQGFWMGFSGKLQKTDQGFTLQTTNSTHSDFKLTGSLSNIQDNALEGRFEIQRVSTNETVTVLYRAYEANLKVKTPRSKNLAEHVNLTQKIQNLKTHTKAWVNDFVIPFGTSTFDISIIQKITVTEKATPTNNAPEAAQKEEEPVWKDLLKFEGRSVETDNTQTEKIEPNQAFLSQDLGEMKLVGNSEGEDAKTISLNLKDDKGEDTEILLDVDRPTTLTPEQKKQQEEQEKKDDEEINKMLQELTPPDQEEEQTEPEVEEPVVEEPAAEVPAPVEDTQSSVDGKIIIPEEVLDFHGQHPISLPDSNNSPSQSRGNNSESYLSASQGRVALSMAKDMDNTYSIPKVKSAIKDLLRKESSSLKKYFKFANPFRGLIKSIAKAYDVVPQFVYLTFLESQYFRGGTYKPVVSSTETSTGAFQINVQTATHLRMKFQRNSIGARPASWDERMYFAPSACAAAKYIGQHAKRFSNDKALAFLAYNRGAGKTAQYARNYGYSYKEISRRNFAGSHYINKVLAVYFVAGKYKGSKFDSGSSAPTQLPSRWVFPSGSIKDSNCQQATAAYR